jgi:hypothetical protein
MWFNKLELSVSHAWYFDGNMISSENSYEGRNVSRDNYSGVCRPWSSKQILKLGRSHVYANSFFFFLSLLLSLSVLFFYSLLIVSQKKVLRLQKKNRRVFVVPLSRFLNNNTIERQKNYFLVFSTKELSLFFFWPCAAIIVE